MTEENKLGSTKKGYALGSDTVYAKEVWNEAIEAAAKECSNIMDSFTDPSHCPYHLTLAWNSIRKLKK